MSAPAWWSEGRVVVFDLETTGLEETAHIIEFGAVLYAAGREASALRLLIDTPEAEVPKEASDIHGITKDRLRCCPAFAATVEAIAGFLDLADVLVGYNAEHFDAPRLASWDKTQTLAGIMLAKPLIDPLVWVRKADRYVSGKGRHKLEATARRRGVNVSGKAHSAVTDCRMTAGVLQTLWRDMGPRATVSDPGRLAEEQTRLAAIQQKEFEAWLAEQEARSAS